VILGANDGGARRSSCSPTLLGRSHHLAGAHSFRTRRLGSQRRTPDNRCGPQRSRSRLGVGRQRISTCHRRFASSDGCHRRNGRLSTGLSAWHHCLQPRIARMRLRAFAADAGIHPRHSGVRRCGHHESERGAGSLYVSVQDAGAGSRLECPRRLGRRGARSHGRVRHPGGGILAVAFRGQRPDRDRGLSAGKKIASGQSEIRLVRSRRHVAERVDVRFWIHRHRPADEGRQRLDRHVDAGPGRGIRNRPRLTLAVAIRTDRLLSIC
jgi:hypothetical protein